MLATQMVYPFYFTIGSPTSNLVFGLDGLDIVIGILKLTTAPAIEVNPSRPIYVHISITKNVKKCCG